MEIIECGDLTQYLKIMNKNQIIKIYNQLRSAI